MLETAFDLLVVNLTRYLGSNIYEVEWLTNAIYIVAFTILLILILLIFFIIVKLMLLVFSFFDSSELKGRRRKRF